jgi:hypothetical protein
MARLCSGEDVDYPHYLFALGRARRYITRSTQGTGGGDGIDACLSSVCGTPLIDRVVVSNAYNGMKLGTELGNLSNSYVYNNANNGMVSPV